MKIKESTYSILQKCPLFNGFSIDEIRQALMLADFKILNYPAKEIYTLAGMPCKYADFIIEGEMIARMTGLSDKQVQIDRLTEATLIAPAFIFGKRNEMPVSVETSKPTTLLRMMPSALKRLIDTDERIRWNFILQQSAINIFLSHKMRMLSLFSVREKVAHFLIKAAAEQQSRMIKLNVSRQEMADMFGIQKFSLLRCLSEFEKNGTIKINGKTIIILNFDNLRETK